jgi:sulfate adenylyltransferase subunit 2
MRVFPLSNWTELDIWRYIARERMELPSLYFAHERDVFERDGMLLAQSQHVQTEGKPVARERVRFRTVGDMTCTAAVRSAASTVDEVIEELERTRISERGATRVDDRYTEAGMEDRKRIGYF